MEYFIAGIAATLVYLHLKKPPAEQEEVLNQQAEQKSGWDIWTTLALIAVVIYVIVSTYHASLEPLDTLR